MSAAECVVTPGPAATETIYRCGWCGFPVSSTGAALPEVGFDVGRANAFLAANVGARVELRDGFCCPGDPWTDLPGEPAPSDGGQT